MTAYQTLLSTYMVFCFIFLMRSGKKNNKINKIKKDILEAETQMEMCTEHLFDISGRERKLPCDYFLYFLKNKNWN